MRFIYSKPFAIFLGSLVALTMLLFLQLRGWIDPVRRAALTIPQPITRGLNYLVVPVRGFFGTILQLKNILPENSKLADRVGELESRLVDYDQIKQENQILKQELGFREKSPNKLIPCTVLAHDPEGITSSMVLSCNLSNGVLEGMAVVAQGHIIAKVVNAGNFTSTARLLFHDDSVVDARVSGQSGLAVVKGSFGSGLVLDLIPEGIEIKPGEMVVTAGLNSRIPKGLLIGVIDKQISPVNDVFRKASVGSPVQTKELEYVFVVKDTP